MSIIYNLWPRRPKRRPARWPCGRASALVESYQRLKTMGPTGSLLGSQHQRAGLGGGLDYQMDLERGAGAPSGEGSNAENQHSYL